MMPVERLMLKEFGSTDDLNETGYILSDGTFVDFSGRSSANDYIRRGDRFVPKRGPDSFAGQRYLDHRQLPENVLEAVGATGGTAGMVMFLKETGALRVMPGTGFKVYRMPTIEALDAFMGGWVASTDNMPVYVDVSGKFEDDSVHIEEPTTEKLEEYLLSRFKEGAGMSGSDDNLRRSNRQVEALKAVLREVEFIEYEDPEEGLQIFCPICGGTPEREKIPHETRAGYPFLGGKGHSKDCNLAIALYGKPAD